jgi:hypothetical protein
MAFAAGFAPDLAADADGRLHLAFVNRFADVDDVYYTSWSQDSGWQLPVNVSEGEERASSPSLAVAGDGTKAMVWSSRSGNLDVIYVAVSDDGVLWSSGPVPHASGVRPKVAIVNGDLLVAWQGPYDVPGSAMEVFVSLKSNHQWTLPVDVSVSPDADSVFPSLTFGAGNAYLAWQEDVPGGPAVFMCAEDAGIWSVPQQRSGDAAAHAPAVAVHQGSGHLAWTTGTSVQYRSWTVSSGTWQPIEDVFVEQVGARDVRLTVNGSPFLAWLAEAGISNDDVYCSIRTGQPTPTPSATSMPTPSQTLPATSTVTPTLTRTAIPSSTPTCTVTLEPSCPLFLPLIHARSAPLP